MEGRVEGDIATLPLARLTTFPPQGWGRTIVDSMAVGVPVIVPLWGGVTEYLNDNISIPIVVKETERVPKGFCKSTIL